MSVLLNKDSVCASAPGKAILFGEHAVVYGEPALAAALSDLRIVVLVTPTQEQRMIYINMPDLPTPIDFSVSTERVCSLDDALCSPPTPVCAERIASILQEQGTEALQRTLNPFAVSALTPLIYLIHQMARDILNHSGLQIWVRSQDLPVGAGLGSSAAFSVAAAAALLQLRERQWHEPTHDTDPLSTTQRPSPDMLQQINHFAYYSEILLHGTPSGIDNTVSTFGGAVLFAKPQPTNEEPNTNAHRAKRTVPMTVYSTRQMPALSTMPLLLVHTHVPRSTKQLVANVRDLYQRHTSTVSLLLQTMGQVARDACDWFVEGDNGADTNADDRKCNKDPRQLLELVALSQHLLRAVGVSHASLDRIVQIVGSVAGRHAAAKLTGAGGGGCAIVLFEPACDQTVVERVREGLEGATCPWNLTCFSSRVAGDGVLLLPPKEFPVPLEAVKRDRCWRHILGITALTAGSATILYCLVARNRTR